MLAVLKNLMKSNGTATWLSHPTKVDVGQIMSFAQFGQRGVRMLLKKVKKQTLGSLRNASAYYTIKLKEIYYV